MPSMMKVQGISCYIYDVYCFFLCLLFIQDLATLSVLRCFAAFLEASTVPAASVFGGLPVVLRPAGGDDAESHEKQQG